MYFLHKKALIVFMLFLSFTTSANMTVYPMTVSLDAKGEGSVRLLSRTNEVQFVKTKILKITNPGTPEEKEVDINSYNGEGLVAMPSKLAIPGGSNKLVRFVSMNIPEKEEIYRVMFQAVPSLDDYLPEGSKGINTEVSVNLVWGILVSVPPAHPKINITLSADHQHLQNVGTQRVKITEIGLCKQTDTDKKCNWKKDNRNIFPEKQYSLPDTKGYARLVVKYKDWIKKTSDEELSFNLN